MPGPEYVDRAGRGLRVGRYQQAHPHTRAGAEQPAAGQEEVQRLERVLGVGRALQDAAALAQHGDQPAAFPPGREGRRQRAGAEPVAVEFVDGARPSRTCRAARRRAPLRASRAILSSSASVGFTPSVVARSRPSTAVRRSECPSIELDIRAERQIVERPDVLGGRRTTSSWLRSAPRTNLRGTASTRLNRSAASSVSAYTVDSEQLPSSTVVTPCRTDSRSPGIEQHLGVVVGVHVDEAGDDPLAGRVDHVRAARLVQRRGGHRRRRCRRECPACGSAGRLRCRRTTGRCERSRRRS